MGGFALAQHECTNKRRLSSPIGRRGKRGPQLSYRIEEPKIRQALAIPDTGMHCLVVYGIYCYFWYLARPKRFELLTPRFVVWCSIQLSYGRVFAKHFRAQGPMMPHAFAKKHPRMSRKRAIATGSGRTWQGPEAAPRRCSSARAVSKGPQNLPYSA
jgi:hypothetical protein